MTLKANPSEAMKQKIADLKAGRPPRRTEPEQTFTDQPKGK